MNKWFYAVPLVIFTSLFVITLNITLSNPSLSNLIVSGIFVVGAILSFILFLRSDKPSEQFTQFTPQQNYQVMNYNDNYDNNNYDNYQNPTLTYTNQNNSSQKWYPPNQHQ